MIRFGDYLKSKVIHEAASQKYKIMMKRPVTFFDGYENIKFLRQPSCLFRYEDGTSGGSGRDDYEQ